MFLDVAETAYLSPVVDYHVSRCSPMFARVVVKLSSTAVSPVGTGHAEIVRPFGGGWHLRIGPGQYRPWSSKSLYLCPARVRSLCGPEFVVVHVEKFAE